MSVVVAGLSRLLRPDALCREDAFFCSVCGSALQTRVCCRGWSSASFAVRLLADNPAVV